MKFLETFSLLLLVCGQSQGQGFWGTLGSILGFKKNPCERDPVPIFKGAVEDFTIRLTKRASYYSNNGNFVISPFSIWLSLAAIAEYSDKPLQPKFFKALSLPEDKCLRNKIYEVASNIEIPGPDVDFKRKRVFAIDAHSSPNSDWLSFNEQHNVLGYLPIEDFNQENFNSIGESMGIQQPQLSFYGNSVLVDRLYYSGLWTSAFSEGLIEPAPFYDDLGQVIATVDYMKMKSRVRLAHIPFINAKVLELPVGTDGRYNMLFTMGVKSNTVNTIMNLWRSSVIVEILKSLTLSLVPIEVAIPRFFMHYGFNAKQSLDDLDFVQVFADPAATKYISDPPALPSYYFQRLDVNISSSSLQRESQAGSTFGLIGETASNIATAVGRDFIANRPFLFSLNDMKTGVTIFTGLYAYPEEQILPPETWTF